MGNPSRRLATLPSVTAILGTERGRRRVDSNAESASVAESDKCITHF